MDTLGSLLPYDAAGNLHPQKIPATGQRGRMKATRSAFFGTEVSRGYDDADPASDSNIPVSSCRIEAGALQFRNTLNFG